MTRYGIPLLALFSFGMLAACETVKGAGQDIQTAGQEISETAEEADE